MTPWSGESSLFIWYWSRSTAKNCAWMLMCKNICMIIWKRKKILFGPSKWMFMFVWKRATSIEVSYKKQQSIINFSINSSRKNTNHDEPDTINTETLINFLNDKQRDPRLNEILYPHYDTKRVMEIINTYERNADYVAKGLISIDGLTNYLVSWNTSTSIMNLHITQDFRCRMKMHLFSLTAWTFIKTWRIHFLTIISIPVTILT